MTIRELEKILNKYNIPATGWEECSYYGFGYFYSGGEFRILKTLDVDYSPWSESIFDGTEEEFVKEWCKTVYSCYYVYDKKLDRKIALFYKMLYEVVGWNQDKNYKVSIELTEENEYMFYIENNVELAKEICEVCGCCYLNDNNNWVCPMSVFVEILEK